MSFRDYVEQSELVSITSEVVHNWFQRFSIKYPYVTLPDNIKRDIGNCSKLHHQEGRDARELAKELALLHPEYLKAGKW